MERVEASFTKHFANGDRGKGMNTPRPTARRERHRITFFLGKIEGKTTTILLAINFSPLENSSHSIVLQMQVSSPAARLLL